MNRRNFLKMVGIAAIAPVAAIGCDPVVALGGVDRCIYDTCIYRHPRHGSRHPSVTRWKLIGRRRSTFLVDRVSVMSELSDGLGGRGS